MHELEADLFEPPEDFADGVLRLVRVLVLVHEPGAPLRGADALVDRMPIEEHERSLVTLNSHRRMSVASRRSGGTGRPGCSRQACTSARDRFEPEQGITGVMEHAVRNHEIERCRA